jgi:hypothetical protein
MPSMGAHRDPPLMQPRKHLKAEIQELEHEADVGESDKTPLILFADIWVVCAIVVTIGIVIGFLAYHFG